MKNKKNMKKLVASFALLALAAAMSGTTTFAWFSMNRDVSAKGVGASAKASQTLVIGKQLEIGDNTKIDFSEAPAVEKRQLTPTTWFASEGLKYLEGDVDSASGKPTGTPTYTIAPASSGTTYYYTDYVFYLAARGDELKGKLSVSFDEDTVAAILGTAANTLVGLRSTQKAYTLAFFAAEDVTSATDGTVTVVSGEPLAKLAVADLFTGSGSTPVVFKSGGADKTFTFPNQSAGEAKAVKIVARLYLDGAAEVKTNDYLRADITDSKAGISGVFNAGTQYFTYNGAGTGKFTAVSGTPSSTEFEAGHYYLPCAASTCNYVYTDKVDTVVTNLGLAFNVTQTA